MLKLCDSSWTAPVLSYIGKDYFECLYLYINFQKYRFDNPNFKIWVSLNENQEIQAIISKYYTGMNIYSKAEQYPLEDFILVIQANEPSIINAVKPIIKVINNEFDYFEAEYGYVGEITEVSRKKDLDIEVATITDMHEIAALLIEDQGLGKHYEIKLLEHQLTERLSQNFGRNYVIRKERKIVCHCATYAQTNELAVTSGVYTHPKERGKGYAYRLYSKLCFDLLTENKEVYAYYYTKEAFNMHEKIGFSVLCEWGKIVKNK